MLLVATTLTGMNSKAENIFLTFSANHNNVGPRRRAATD